MVQVMKIASFKRTHACIATLSYALEFFFSETLTSLEGLLVYAPVLEERESGMERISSKEDVGF